jgi:hypothetical protein
MDRVWPNAPTGSDLRGVSTINEHRFAYTGRPAVFGVNRDFWKPESDLDEFNFTGTLPVSRAEQSHVDAVANYAPGSRFATLQIGRAHV